MTRKNYNGSKMPYEKLRTQLVVKIRKVGSSLVLTIPKNLALLYDFKEDEWMRITIANSDGIRYKKVEM